jgi:hypothetical protein
MNYRLKNTVAENSATMKESKSIVSSKIKTLGVPVIRNITTKQTGFKPHRNIEKHLVFL